MNRIAGLLLVCILGLAACSSSTENTGDPTPDQAKTPPNIVFLLIDDLGISSLPLYESMEQEPAGEVRFQSHPKQFPYHTPNLDTFSKDARVYTHMYATSLCAPSRGQLITGRYPFRNGIVYPAWSQDTMAGYYPNNQQGEPAIVQARGHLDTNQVGYPAVLQAMGYETVFGGKWNLRYGTQMCDLDGDDGGDSTSYVDVVVRNQADHLKGMGFTSTFNPKALVGNTIDYYPLKLYPNESPEDQYLPTHLFNWMSDQLISGRQSGKPQYLHYCFGLIHDPYNADCNEYGYSPPPSDLGDSSHAHVFADKLAEVDMLIGKFVQLIDSIDSLNGTETLIIIAGDNGTESTYYNTFNGNWVEGGKSTNTSNGSRVPFLVRWKGTVKPGVDSTLADFADIFPTMVELVGGEDALDSLVAAGNPGYSPSYAGGQNPTPNDMSYRLDGQSMLYEMTGGNWGSPIAPRIAVYAQTARGSGPQANSQALLADRGYKLGIYRNPGYFAINDRTLADSMIQDLVCIQALGDTAISNPCSTGTAAYDSYNNLVAYYYTLFPTANPNE